MAVAVLKFLWANRVAVGVVILLGLVWTHGYRTAAREGALDVAEVRQEWRDADADRKRKAKEAEDKLAEDQRLRERRFAKDLDTLRAQNAALLEEVTHGRYTTTDAAGCTALDMPAFARVYNRLGRRP